MTRSSFEPVTPSLSGPSDDLIAGPGIDRRPTSRAGKGEAQRLGLLGRQRAVRPAVADRLGVDASTRPRVEAAHDEARAGGVGQGKGEALVAAGVLERVEPDEADALDRVPPGSLEDGRSRREIVELAGDRIDLVEMGFERPIETYALGPAGEPVETVSQPPDPAGLGDRQQEQNERRCGKPDDGRSDERRDEGIEIDRWVLRGSVRGERATGGPSLAGGHARSIIWSAHVLLPRNLVFAIRHSGAR